MILLLAIFLFCAGSLAAILNRYRNEEKLYIDTAKQYMLSGDNGTNEENVKNEAETAPISIDFESLQAINSDIIGWIYCEDTPINYPILKGEDNDTYLHHTYEGSYSSAGSIFVDAANRSEFADSNTIIYGHNMKNGSMFASLQNWLDQEYYEEHPIMWLLTPKQDYKIVLFSGYATSVYSDTYTIFTGSGAQLNDYLENCVEQSDFQADVELDQKGYYVLLSTCAYMFENARYVLHGMLVPVGG